MITAGAVVELTMLHVETLGSFAGSRFCSREESSVPRYKQPHGSRSVANRGRKLRFSSCLVALFRRETKRLCIARTCNLMELNSVTVQHCLVATFVFLYKYTGQSTDTILTERRKMFNNLTFER